MSTDRTHLGHLFKVCLQAEKCPALVGMIVLFVLFIVLTVIVAFLQEHRMLTELKGRYNLLIKHLQETDAVDERFKILRTRRPILTGIDSRRMNKGTIGYNVNKGYEIYICLDGNNVNAAMHVLIHELAHITVPEYDHSEAFWQSFKDLRTLCTTLGLYSLNQNQPYCGGEIHD